MDESASQVLVEQAPPEEVQSLLNQLIAKNRDLQKKLNARSKPPSATAETSKPAELKPAEPTPSTVAKTSEGDEDDDDDDDDDVCEEEQSEAEDDAAGEEDSSVVTPAPKTNREDKATPPPPRRPRQVRLPRRTQLPIGRSGCLSGEEWKAQMQAQSFPNSWGSGLLGEMCPVCYPVMWYMLDTIARYTMCLHVYTHTYRKS